jgi:hypothetical protein
MQRGSIVSPALHTSICCAWTYAHLLHSRCMPPKTSRMLCRIYTVIYLMPAGV